MIQRKYGWSPDIPDNRDLMFSPVRAIAQLPLPKFVRLFNSYDEVYDQGQLGSCTANAIAMAINMEMIRQGQQAINPSRLFIYYNERVLEQTASYDAGAQIRDGIKTICQTGICPETEWPYDISKFADKPTDQCYTDAAKDMVKMYLRINNTSLLDIKSCLAAGYPFVFGFSVYPSFESEEVAQTGKMTMPLPDEKLIGGHAVICIGYDDNQGVAIVRNSWGSDWGIDGHFYMPYDYMTNPNLADDFWSIRLI